MESFRGKAVEGVKTVVITGGSSGIGEYFIRRLHRLSSDLLFCNISRAEPSLDSSIFPIRHIPCDLGRRDQLEAAAGEAGEICRKRGGKVLLINNSGFGAYGIFPGEGLAHTLDMVEVNVKAPVHLTGLLLPLLKERGGAIVNVASTAAFQPTPYMSTYGATKAFLLHWSLGLGQDLREDGVQVLCVCPGPTSTRFYARAGFERPVVSDRVGQRPEEVVEAAVRALQRGRSLVVSGRLNRILAATSSRLPKTLVARWGERVLRRYRQVDGRGK